MRATMGALSWRSLGKGTTPIAAMVAAGTAVHGWAAPGQVAVDPMAVVRVLKAETFQIAWGIS